MRICISLVILLTLVGCSRQLPTEHHILPAGFSGVYKIVKLSGNSGGYKNEGSRYIFTIPENGVLRVSSDVFSTQCLACNGLSAAYTDGQEIQLYSPIKPPPDSAANALMLLGLINDKDSIWYAVGTHKQLTKFLDQVREEMYQNLERYLPPNKPFQSQGEVSKAEMGNL